jgi:hypothetical protein
MRRDRQRTEHNSTQTAKSRKYFDAERSIRELQERVSKLERVVQQSVGYDLEDLGAFPTSERKRPGPKPKHSSGMLTHNRDELVQMLELYWPEIEPLCWPMPNRQGLEELWQRIARHDEGLPPSQQRHLWAAQHLLTHLPKVIEFLAGDRFRRDPRQIANAFAGVPNIRTWRSLKLCQASPCNDAIGRRAIRAYIRRKHRKLYERLSTDHSIVNFATALRAYRTRDASIRALSAEYLLGCWDDSTRRII